MSSVNESRNGMQNIVLLTFVSAVGFLVILGYISGVEYECYNQLKNVLNKMEKYNLDKIDIESNDMHIILHNDIIKEWDFWNNNDCNSSDLQVFGAYDLSIDFQKYKPLLESANIKLNDLT